MKIGVYCNTYHPEDGGASSLVNTILKEIRERVPDGDEYIFLYSGSEKEPYRKEIDDFIYLNVNAGKRLSIDFLSKCSRVLCKELSFRLDRIADQEHIDLLWFTAPFYTGVTIPYIFPVWDLGHRTTTYPEVSRKYVIRARDFLYTQMLRRATYVLSGNQTGKDEIIQYFGTDADKIHLAPFPVSSFCFGASEKPSFDLPEQFFFYPAQFWPHKNHITILKALDCLRSHHNLRPTVFFTGSDHGHLSFIKKETERLDLSEQIRFTGFLSNGELKYLYEHATAMIFASMMGPNNLPPYEAAFLKCPVIITNIAGHVEQMRDCALYFDGLSGESLAEQMLTILQNPEVRGALIAREEMLRPELEKINYFKTVQTLIHHADNQAADES